MTVRHQFAAVAWIGALALLFGAAGGAQDPPPKKDKYDVKKEPAPPLKKSPFKKKQNDAKTEVLRETDELLKTDPLDPVRGRQAHFKAYSVKMSPGKTYVIRLFNENPSGNIDPFLRLEDSAGRNLAMDDDGEGNLNSRIEHNPTREDTYKVIATTLSGPRTGKFLVTVDAYTPGRVPPPGRVGGAGVSMNTGPLLTTAPPLKHRDVEISCMTWGQSINPGNNIETHGYIEYRFFIDNHSNDEHRISLTLPRRGAGHFNSPYLTALRKTVGVGPGESVQVSLFQPDLPMVHIGQGAEAEIDGRPAPQPVPINTWSNRGARANAGRFWGGGSTPHTPSFSFLTMPSMQGPLANHQSKIAGTAATQLLMHHAPENIEQWSRQWLGYTSFDGVILAGPKLQAAPNDVQTALWQFVECGGTLVLVGPSKLPPSWERARVEFAGLSGYYPGFGQCLALKELPDKWLPEQWQAVNEMWSTSRAAWHQITSPSDANRALTVVEDVSIPVRGLFVVMVVFVLLIGPVNVYWLARAQRRLWLLWTVPSFAFLACLLLVGYMVATEGWHGHARSESITILDENAQRAATIGWIGYYCPTTPAGGLRFGLDTELTPHLDFRHVRSGGRSSQPCSIDWTNQQHLAEGWVSAKVPLHFMVRRNEPRLERLTARANPDGTGSVTNGLGTPIQSLWVAKLDGTIVGARDIAPGANATLTPTDLPAAGGDLGTASDVFSRNWVQQADEMAKKPADYLRPGTYLAVIDDAPFLDQGLRQTQTRRARSIVFGIMKEPF